MMRFVAKKVDEPKLLVFKLASKLQAFEAVEAHKAVTPPTAPPD